MCGLAGISLNPQDKKLNVRIVSAALLESIASRGPDATGAAWYNHETDEVFLTKVAAPVHKFLPARIDILPETTPVMILHTRFGTHGSAQDRANNHPIHYGNIIGVHNGVLWGHKAMFTELGLKATAEVDSEALMALLSQAPRPEKVMGKIKGDAAMAWIDLDDPEVLHLAHPGGRSLAIAQTKEGSLIFASTMTAVMAAAAKTGLELEYKLDIPEGKYLKVKDGIIVDYLDTAKPDRNRQWSSQYDWTNGNDRGTTVYGKQNQGWQRNNTTAKNNTTTPAKAVAAAKAATTPKALTAGTATAATSKPATVDHGPVTQMVLSELISRSKKGSAEAAAELLRRGYTTDGKYLDHKIDGVRITDLVAYAAGGSVVAVEALEKYGYDRTGLRVVPPKVEADESGKVLEFRAPK